MKNKHELEALADYLECYDIVRPEGYHFDINHWHDDSMECGTVACAIGHLKFAFPETKLLLEGDGPEFLEPVFDGQVELDAVRRYFSMSLAEAHIFWPDHYARRQATPREVAAEIRRILEEDNG